LEAINDEFARLYSNKLFRTDRMKGLEIQSMDIQTAGTVGNANSVIYDTCTCGFHRQSASNQSKKMATTRIRCYLLVLAVE
jgi:hypothetical protein